MEQKTKQHVQLPTDDDKDKLNPSEVLIYLTIKRHQNKDTQKAFPSLQTISEESGASVPTVRKLIKRLIDLKYITCDKDGRKNVYSFNPYKYYEAFSYDFLDNKKLDFTEKAYLACSQKYMVKEDGKGTISYTNEELSKLINMPKSTISKVNRSLQNKNLLTVIENGLRTTKVFDMNAYGQAIVFILKNHEERIGNNEERIEDLEKFKKDKEKHDKEMMNIIKDLKTELQELKKKQKEQEKSTNVVMP